MRILSILAGLLSVCFAAYSQTEPNRAFWSGNLQFNKIRLTGDYPSGITQRTPDLSVQITHGVFLRNNWLVGGSVSGSYYRQESTNPSSKSEQIIRRAGLSGFVRKYWGKNQWRIFAGGGLGGNVEQIRSEITNTPNQKTSTFAIAPFTELGGLYFLTDRWALELSTSTSAFPFSFSTFNAGLVLVTGSTPEKSAILAATPPTEATQTRGGRVVVGASAVFSDIQAEQGVQSGKAQQFSAAPSVGIFVANNVQVGVAVPVTWYTLNTNAGLVRTTSLGLSPFVQAYLTKTRLRPFAGVAFSYSTYSYKQDDFPREEINKTIGGALNGGIAYLLGRHFIVDANLISLSVNKQTQNNQFKNGQWDQSFQLTTRPTFAVQYVF